MALRAHRGLVRLNLQVQLPIDAASPSTVIAAEASQSLFTSALYL